VSKLKAYILDRFANTNRNYTSWIDQSPYDCEIVEHVAPNWTVPSDAGIVITHMHYRWEEVSAMRRIVEENQVPVLVLADGVLEYRNTWENPSIADGAIFQPLMAHKLACIGRGQARTIESWDNVGKCEVVGLPRFDEMIGSECLPVQPSGPFRLLVTSANTPAFTSAQRKQVVKSLKDLYARVSHNPWAGKRKIQIHWRLTDGLAAEVGLPHEQVPVKERLTLTEAIENSDAVITTPSTIYLESVIKRRPTAILDYSNSPQYFNSAWNITAPVHISPILEELVEPPPAKMMFQRATLHDQLECGSAATPRLLALINAMVTHGSSARQNGTKIDLPPRILADPQQGIQVVESEFDKSTLFPDNPIFLEESVVRLQGELNQAVQRLGQLPAELDRKDADIVRKDKHIQQLSGFLDEAWQRVAELREKEANYIDQLKEKSHGYACASNQLDALDKALQATLNRFRLQRAETQMKTQVKPQKKAAEIPTNQPVSNQNIAKKAA
jgi:hypothetical protein